MSNPAIKGFICKCGSDDITFDNDRLWCKVCDLTLEYHSNQDPIRVWIDAMDCEV